jgi:hypothetical protein
VGFEGSLGRGGSEAAGIEGSDGVAMAMAVWGGWWVRGRELN